MGMVADLVRGMEIEETMIAVFLTTGWKTRRVESNAIL